MGYRRRESHVRRSQAIPWNRSTDFGAVRAATTIPNLALDALLQIT